MSSGANVKLWLKIGDVSEAEIDCIRLGKMFQQNDGVSRSLGSIKTLDLHILFQDRAKFLVRVEAMDDRQSHQSALGNPVVEKE